MKTLLQGTFRYFDTNAIFVKELRQAACSKLVPGTLLLLLGGFLVITALVVLVGEVRGFGGKYPGQPLFEALSLFLAAVVFLFLPVYLYCRTMFEHVAGNADLSFITTLTPVETMEGKTRAAAYLTGLFYSLSLPFLLCCVLMKGVDIPTILLTTFLLFSLNLLLSVGSVTLGVSNLELVPKTTVAMVSGCTLVLGGWVMASKAILGPTIPDLLADPLAGGMVWKVPLAILAWFALFRFAFNAGLRSIANTNKKDPHPLVRFAMKRRTVDKDGKYIGQTGFRPDKKFRMDPSTKLYRKPGGSRRDKRPSKEEPDKPLNLFNKESRREAALRLREALVGSGYLGRGQGSFQLWPRYWDFNPVWVKDFLQAARNPYVTGTLVGLLVVFYLTTFVVAIHGNRTSLGWEVFNAVSGIASFVSSLFLPVYFFTRTQIERSGNYPDLLFISDMSPSRIIQGKFLGALYLILLFYSITAPFLVSSYLFKGIDFPTIILELVYSILVNVLLSFGAITLGLAPMASPFKILLGIGSWSGIQWASNWLDKSGGIPLPAMVDPAYGFPELLQGGIYILNTNLIAGLLYKSSIALISPPAMNRAFAVRKYITYGIFLACCQFLVLAWVSRTPELATGTIRGVSLFLLVGYLFIVCRKETRAGRRIRWQIPKRGLARIFAFPFFNGKFQGLVWLTVLGSFLQAGFVGYGLAMDAFRPLPETKTLEYFTTCAGMMTVTFYGFAYALLAISFQRGLFRKGPTWAAGVVYLLLLFVPAAALAVPGLGLPPQIPGVAWTAWIAMAAGQPGLLVPHLAVSPIIALVGMALHYRWISTRIRNFAPPQDIPLDLAPAP